MKREDETKTGDDITTPKEEQKPFAKSTCPGHKFQTHYLQKAAIFADEDRVYGMRMLSALGVVDIGSVNKGTTYLDEFSP